MFLRKLCLHDFTANINKQPISLLAKRNFLPFVDYAFNAVEKERLKQVGPDRLCAEWILKHGGSVRLSIEPAVMIADYNLLPDEKIAFRLLEIDATDTQISTLGFDHLENCNHISRIVLNRCNNLNNDGIPKLEFVKNSLQFLQISKCWSIRDSGVLSVKNLINLKEFVCFGLNKVENMKSIEAKLRVALPNCKFQMS